MAELVPRERLDKFFESIEPQYVLGTTYTLSLAFFESVIFPSLHRGRLRRCLILSDALGYERAMAEATALQNATRDYFVATVPSQGSFHAKVWILLNDRQLAVLVGSGNLTQSGFVNNVELFEAVQFELGSRGRKFGLALLRFLSGLRSLWPNSMGEALLAVQTLREMESSLKSLVSGMSEEEEDAPQFWSSFEKESAVDAMRSVRGCRKAYIAAPYFGRSLEGIRKVKDACQPAELFVYPAVDAGAVDLPIQQLASVTPHPPRRLKLAIGDSFAHLKLYGFETNDDYGVLFTTSANCTLAALTGKNIEAGFWRRVDPELLRLYFEAGADVQEPMRVADESASASWISLWATDFGDRIELTVGPADRSRLPLTSAKVTLLVGGARSQQSFPSLFAQQSRCSIPWAKFGELRRSAAARVIEICGTSPDGCEVRGVVLVDDLVALTAEPSHRGAWRAAVAVLGSEGLPEFADLSALFALASDVAADGDSEAVTAASRAPSGSTDTVKKEKIAVWPPQPLPLDFTAYHTAGAGHIYWFDRIMSSLAAPASKKPATGSIAAVNEGDVEDEAEIDERAVERRRVAGDKLWRRAADGYDRLIDRLHQLEIQKSHASRIWGPGVCMLLAALAVRQAVVRSNPDSRIPSTVNIAWRFLQTLFLDRIQDEDFEATAKSPYFEMSTFPPICSDLTTRFHLHPQYLLCPILCLAFAHVRAVRVNELHGSSKLAWARFREVGGDFVETALEDEEHLKSLWDRFFRDKTVSQWETIRSQLQVLKSARWSDVEGVQELRCLQAYIRTRAIGAVREDLRVRLQNWDRSNLSCLVINRSDSCCPNPRCPQHGFANVKMAQATSELRVLICDGCGYLLVPEELRDALKGVSND